ncbi:MAG: phosphoribosylaminoimidazolesuccinocarboxamide synthase [Alphaproteobacteria bacterium]|nr:MAG: phosphoribosylaminoimidazolesuccinocarboxamide synthase [Alphaproteobacteria bacterium]
MSEPEIKTLKHLHSGKVRDLYEINPYLMLMVASDRISAFDVVLDDTIPGKGEVLTQMSLFWFGLTKNVIPNHLVKDISVANILEDPNELAWAANRSMVVRRLKPLPVEAIVRGYIIGSGWSDYQKTGQVGGIVLPEHLQLAQKLDEPIYTPSTKAAIGEHDQNITYDDTVQLLGADMAAQVRTASLALYIKAAKHALGKGIIIADTKFEFGTDRNGKLVLMDEALTSDSSRFWSANKYQVGRNPPSFDKQYVRDWLTASGWNKEPPAPRLPQDVIQKTAARYAQAQRLLCTI